MKHAGGAFAAVLGAGRGDLSSTRPGPPDHPLLHLFLAGVDHDTGDRTRIVTANVLGIVAGQTEDVPVDVRYLLHDGQPVAASIHHEGGHVEPLYAHPKLRASLQAHLPAGQCLADDDLVVARYEHAALRRALAALGLASMSHILGKLATRMHGGQRRALRYAVDAQNGSLTATELAATFSGSPDGTDISREDAHRLLVQLRGFGLVRVRAARQPGVEQGFLVTPAGYVLEERYLSRR